MLTLDLSDRGALVTGVTRGIGAEIARTLAEAGCNVAGGATSSPDSDGAQRFVADVEERGRDALYVQADLTEEDDIAELVARTGERFGVIDVLVSNAGRNVFEGVQGCSLEAWEDCMDLDLKAHWRVSRHARSWMGDAEDPVAIIISSNHAGHTIPGCFPYNVAKAGLGGLVQSLAVEWGPDVRAVGIAPGFIDTPINEEWFSTFDDPAAERRETEARHPVGKIGDPEEIAGLCAFLASDYGGFISGTTILADGGRAALMQDGPRYVDDCDVRS